MSENPQRVIAVGEVMVELARGKDARYSLAYGGDTFNTAVYLARAGIPVAYATALGDDPYSDGALALAAAEGIACDLVLRNPGARALPLPDRGRRGGRPALSLLGRSVAGTRSVRAAGLGPDRRKPADGPDGLFLRHHAVALFQHRARPLSRDTGNGAPEGRQGGVRRQLSRARLERRCRAHPHRVHGGAQAGRSRAADLRRRGRAVGRYQPERHGGAPAGLRRRRNRREERPNGALVAARTAASTCRCRRWSIRSTRLRPATASTPPIWRPVCAAKRRSRRPGKAHRVAAEKIRHRGAIMPRATAAMH